MELDDLIIVISCVTWDHT